LPDVVSGIIFCGMLNDLRTVFRKTWESFRTELSRREPEDQVAELLGMMRREMVDARASLPHFEQAIGQVEAEISAERKTLADCHRRRTLAERIGDTETVQIADDFIVRHEERVVVLQQKLIAARAERDLRAREIEQMSRKYKEADANRFALLSQLRSQRAHERMRGALDGTAGPFSEFDRMTEAVHEQSAYADALEELADLGGNSGPTPSGPSAPEQDVEERLRELKRRMGRE
jgi:phage shock protein A